MLEKYVVLFFRNTFTPENWFEVSVLTLNISDLSVKYQIWC